MYTTKDSLGMSRRDVLRVGGFTFLATVSAPGCDLLETAPDENRSGVTDANDSPVREAPMLTKLVESGDLPPLDDRLPPEPLVVQPVDRPGVYGGEWRTALLGPADTSWLSRTIGYDPLLRWDRDFTEPLPNLAEAVDVGDEGREFTVRLRAGVKWSDGEPFTADDILFAYDDVLSNDELPWAVPTWLTAEGKPATFEKLDDLTVRVQFNVPHGLFLQYLAVSANTLLTWPKHYFEQFHQNHNPGVGELADEEGVDGWTALFEQKGQPWQNADVPTVYAWHVTTPLSDGTRVVAERNPYYWKIDSDGRQLPYLDRVVFDVVADEEVILLKATNGELDMHSRHINSLENKPVLAQSRETGDYEFFDVAETNMNFNVVALNLTHQDPVKREIFQNKDFRIGLSHAVNRQELIDVIFQRQGEPWQAAPRRESPFFDEELAKQYTEYDVDRANRYLDQAGYTDRDDEGFRLGPDGNRISFNVEVATGFRPYQIDATELVQEHWRDVGVDARLNSIDRSLFQERQDANEHDAAVWGGGQGGLDAMLGPYWYLPFSAGSRYAIPWVNWYNNTDGPEEEPPPDVKRQMEIYDQLKETIDDEEKIELFRQILQIAKEEFYAIGTVLMVGIYGIVKNNFHNVPTSMPGGAIYPNPGPTNPEQYFID